ncbi:hypothetical protein PHYBOEH_009174 [Phytophthora boehmeriae]|uniref:Uncharacterized protein n=1 Tax=Phytophthora boehmeriae TaxID=109152 RepID=A0A8T1VV59_9STRA|nr:hypothetical protein PHYBOEH_009174 [Phytophthora boehmeriae]
MASPSSPLLQRKPSTRSMASDSVNISSKLRRNSLVSDVEDMNLLREKLNRIAVGRHHSETKCFKVSTIEEPTRPEHFKVFPLLTSDRPNTPPSSPQPRDVLRKQLRLKQRATSSCREEDTLDQMVSVDDMEISAMDGTEEDNHAVHSPPRGRGRQAKLSIPGHLRVLSPFSVLNKYPEGLRKRKSVHVDDGHDGAEDRVSLKKTSSQINILANSTSVHRLPRSSSATGDMCQAFAAQTLDQDHDMEECVTRPQSPQIPLFAGAIKNKHDRLSATCS